MLGPIYSKTAYSAAILSIIFTHNSNKMIINLSIDDQFVLDAIALFTLTMASSKCINSSVCDASRC